jgi:hypothetical protein
MPDAAGNPLPPSRPFSEKRKSLFLLELARTGSIRGSAARAGVARQTIYNEVERNPSFREDIDRAVDEAEQALVDSIVKAANTGKVIERRGTTVSEPGDWRAGAWLLEHSPFFRDRYAGILRQKVELGGSDDLPAIDISGTVKHELDVGPEMMDRLQAVVGVLLKAGKLRLPEPAEVDGDDTGA